MLDKKIVFAILSVALSSTAIAIILSPQTQAAIPHALAASPATDLPDRLIIPSVYINSPIIPVGLTKTGNLDVPPNYTEVGWYRYGPRPGGNGSAVLDGHVDNGKLIPGPFKNLKNTSIGDEIFVTMEGGQAIRFIITATAIYDYKEFPGELIFHDNTGALLQIITCHGTWLAEENTYDRRLVVTAIRA